MTTLQLTLDERVETDRTPLRDQAIKVVVSLVGPQDIAVVAHRPGTEGARVSVRVGGALIYILDAETARAFHQAWQSGALQARSLPVRSDPTRVMPIAGVAEPVVMMEAAESPPAGARLDQIPGRRTSLGHALAESGSTYATMPRSAQRWWYSGGLITWPRRCFGVSTDPGRAGLRARRSFCGTTVRNTCGAHARLRCGTAAGCPDANVASRIAGSHRAGL